jgi:hypothetical protein
MTAGLSCAELRPLLGGYVLDGLEPHEAEAVRAHLPGCAICRAELDALAELPRLLDLAAPVAHPVEPLPPSLEEALLDRFAREADVPRPKRRRRRPRFVWTRPRVALASGLLAAVLAVGATLALQPDDSPPRASRNYVVALEATAQQPAARARISLYRVDGGTGVHLWASGLERGSERVYEMLCEKGDWSASAGTFRADGEGKVDIRLTTAARLGEYERVRVVSRDEDGHVRDVLTGRLY